jgi:hypothetical protein
MQCLHQIMQNETMCYHVLSKSVPCCQYLILRHLRLLYLIYNKNTELDDSGGPILICILSYYHKHMCQKSSNMKSFQHGDIPTFLPGFPCNFPCRVLRNPCLDASDHISGRLLNGWFEHVETLPIFDALLGYNVSPPMGKVGKTKTMYSWWVWDSGNGLFKSQSRLAA